LLDELAVSAYRLGDLGQSDLEFFTDEGFLNEIFQYQSDIYGVFDTVRTDWPEGFPLLKVIAAAHPNTPVPTLLRLSQDPDPEVLWAVAGNSSATREIHTQVISSNAVLPSYLEMQSYSYINDWEPDSFGSLDNWDVYDVPISVSAAGNRNIDSDLIQWVVDSEHPLMIKALLVRNADRLTMPQWHTLLGNGLRYRASPQYYLEGDWLLWMADSRNLPAALHSDILNSERSGDVLARRLVARDTSTLDDLKMVFAHAPTPGTRARIAAHPHVTEQMLNDLALDPVPKVRQAVVNSPFATDEQKAMAALHET